MYFPSQFQEGVDEKLLIYFHGNSEDLGAKISEFQIIKKQLNISVLAVEYPGFGIY
mgnify:FL=1